MGAICPTLDGAASDRSSSSSASAESDSDGMFPRGEWDSELRDIHEFYEFSFRDVSSRLGSGFTAKVTRGRCKETDEAVAIKKISKFKIIERKGRDISLRHEINHMMELSGHPNICMLFSVFESNEHIYLVEELSTGGDLMDYLQTYNQISEPNAAVIVSQILDGLHYAHKYGIVHRDIKPENILFKQPYKLNLCITDWGLSAMLQPGEYLQDVVGSAHYVAPEVLNKHYDEKCDLWSTGVIAYMMLGASQPFNAESDSELLDMIRRGQVSFEGPAWDMRAPGCKGFVQGLLTIDPQSRMSAPEALSQPWMTELLQCSNNNHTDAINTKPNAETTELIPPEQEHDE